MSGLEILRALTSGVRSAMKGGVLVGKVKENKVNIISLIRL